MKNQLRADTINGVYVAEVNPNIDMPILYDMDFYYALDTCSENEVLYGLVSDDVAKLIQYEYGIH